MTQQFDLFESAGRARKVPSFAQAKAERDTGIERAVAKADRRDNGWSDRAYRWIVQYARLHKTFISEDCTADAAEAGLASPADPRAWGHPFKKASKDGVIRRIGFGISQRRHLSPTPLWESQLI